MRTERSGGRRLRSVLFYLGVTILGLLLTGMIILFVTRVNRTFYSYTTEPDTLLRMLNRGEYANAWREVQNNRAQGETEQKDRDYVLPYAVVDYFEAESYYNACLGSDDAEKAAQYRETMDEAYEAMGELQFLAEEIDEIFE